MNRKKPVATACLAAIAASCFLVPELPAQSQGGPELDDSVRMIVNYGQGKEKRRRSREGMMEPVGMPSNQAVAITLEFPKKMAGMSVMVSPLDGGEITAPGPLSVSADGSILFNFQTDGTPGLHRLLVQLPTETCQLQFYAFNPNRPANLGPGPSAP